MGRPSSLTPERTKRITELISGGNSLEVAAQASGITATTFFNWCARGRRERERLEQNPRLKPKKSEEIYVEFLEDVERARAEGEARLVLVVTKKAMNDWRAAAWMLERKAPERWGKPWRPMDNSEAAKAAGEVVKAIELLVKTAQ